MPSRQELIAELEHLHEDSGRTPTEALMAGQGDYDPAAYHEMFGSWENALREAGFDPEQRVKERYQIVDRVGQEYREKIVELLESNESGPFFRGQLLVEIHRLAVDLGETPSVTDMEEYGRYYDSPYRTHFGSWTAAVEAAGLTPKSKRNRISDEDLLSELRRVADEVGDIPTVTDMRKRGEYAVPTYFAHFDSWQQAKKRAGILNHKQE